MTIYLIKGYLDVAATSLADAQALYTALLDQADADNLATIDRVTGKLETLVQSDTGEPIVLSSIDDAAGTISSWVTSGSTSVAVGLGDADPHNALVYCSLATLTVSGSTRVGTLALNTTGLQAAMSGWGVRPVRPLGVPFTLQIQKTAGGYTETMGLLTVPVRPAVLTATPTDLAAATYLNATQVAALVAAQVRTLYSVIVPVGNVGTGEDDLISQVIAAGTLATNGDRLRATASFSVASGASPRNIRMYFGSTQPVTIVTPAGLLSVVVELLITRLTATTQGIAARWQILDGTGAGLYMAATETLASAITLKATGEGGSTDDIIQKELLIEFLPAP